MTTPDIRRQNKRALLIVAGLLAFFTIVGLLMPTPERAASPRPTTTPSPSPSSTPNESKSPGYVSREEYGDAWPLTVDSGVLVCDQSRGALGAVVFAAGGSRYGINGMAKSQGYPPINPIWRYATPTFDGTPVVRIPESERQRIFANVVACQDAGNGAAHDEACLAQARRRFGLTALELTRVNRIAPRRTLQGWRCVARFTTSLNRAMVRHYG